MKFVVFVQNQTELWFSFTPAYTFGIFLGNLEVFWKSGVFCQKIEKQQIYGPFRYLSGLARNCVFLGRNLEICSFRAKSNRTLIFLYPCLYFWNLFRKSGGFLKIWSFLPKNRKKQHFWTLPVLERFGAKFCFFWRNLEICSFRAKSNRTLIFPYPCLYFWNLFGKSGVFCPKFTKTLDFWTLPVLKRFGAKLCFFLTKSWNL